MPTDITERVRLPSATGCKPCICKIGPDDLQVAVSKAQVEGALNIEQHREELSQADESSLYHHFELNYTPPKTESGRRLARR